MKRKVLVVDDEEIVRDLYENVLRILGYEVVSAGNGSEGLKRAYDENPELVIVDYNMPGMNGGDLVRKLRGDERTNHVKILGSSGNPNNEKCFKEAGADEFLSKPSNLSDLGSAVKRLLGE